MHKHIHKHAHACITHVQGDNVWPGRTGDRLQLARTLSSTCCNSETLPSITSHRLGDRCNCDIWQGRGQPALHRANLYHTPLTLAGTQIPASLGLSKSPGGLSLNFPAKTDRPISMRSCTPAYHQGRAAFSKERPVPPGATRPSPLRS